MPNRPGRLTVGASAYFSMWTHAVGRVGALMDDRGPPSDDEWADCMAPLHGEYWAETTSAYARHLFRQVRGEF